MRAQFKEEWQDLDDGTCPATRQQDRDCGRIRGEYGKEMNVMSLGMGDLILKKRVDARFLLSPIPLQSSTK